jgi:hypothetical protein
VLDRRSAVMLFDNVALSDGRGLGERAPSRRYLKSGLGAVPKVVASNRLGG